MKVAIVSGKGGTGKSSITASFISISKSALAMDCDVDASNLYMIFNPIIENQEVYISGKYANIDAKKCQGCGLCQSKCRYDAIKLEAGAFVVDEVSCEGCGLCARICPSGAISMRYSDKSRIYSGTFRYGNMIFGRLAPGEENSGKLINKLRTRADELCEKLAIKDQILDGPPGIGCPVISTITGVDKVVIITEPSLSGISDLKRIYQTAIHFTSAIYVLINKCDLDAENSEAIRKWCAEQSIVLAGELPFDRVVVDAMVRRASVVEAYPDSLISAKITEAYNKIFKGE